MNQKFKVLLSIILLFLFSCESIVDETEKKIEPIPQNSNLGWQIPLPNPMTEGSYTIGQYGYKWRFSSNDDYFHGRYFYPKNKTSSSHLVLILHGNGYHYNDYKKLQEHLAKNGFASASIQWPSWDYAQEANSTRDILEKNLKFLYETFFLSKNKLTNNIALIGHSRGGMAIVETANTVKNYGKTVKAIISAAPSPQSRNMNQNFSLYNQTDGFLVLYGTNDGDVSGNGSAGNFRTGFRLYDKASTEYSTFNKRHTNKDMIYLQGANHRLIRDFGQSSDNIFRDASIGYCNAYLKLYLNGYTAYNQFFKFQKRMPNMDANITYFSQHSDDYKRVIANFQNNSKTTNTLGGSILYQSDIISYVGDSWVQYNKSPHETKLMRLYWNKKSSSPYVRFYIPSNYRNFSSYKYISFRAEQRYNTSYNTVGEDQDFSVRLKSSNGTYQDVKISDYGTLPFSLEKFGGNFDPGSLRFRGGMNTIQIPLSAFTNIDLSSVARVSLRFNRSGHEKGAIHFDNIELLK